MNSGDLFIYQFDYIKGNVSDKVFYKWYNNINPIFKRTENQIIELLNQGYHVYIKNYGLISKKCKYNGWI